MSVIAEEERGAATKEAVVEVVKEGDVVTSSAEIKVSVELQECGNRRSGDRGECFRGR